MPLVKLSELQIKMNNYELKGFVGRKGLGRDGGRCVEVVSTHCVRM